MEVFSNKDYLWLLQQLDGKHVVFYRLWLVGKPKFTDSIPRAAVTFNEEGQNIDFLLNKEFWDSLSDNQKLFVVCHECLHIILDHGVRFFTNKKIDKIVANYATDVAINHYCVNNFGFDREEIDPENEYCWTDTVFTEQLCGKGVKVPEDNKSSEWYYNRIPKSFSQGLDGGCKSDSDEPDEDGDCSGPSTIDSHEVSEGSDFSDVFEEMNDELNDEEKEALKELIEDQTDPSKNIQAGTVAGRMIATVDTTPVKKKKKWESVIKKWALQYLKTTTKEESQWARINRRFVMLPDDMFIPTDMEVEDKEMEEERIQVWFFQDTSGSCSGYRQRFFNAAKSLPEDRFDIRMFCFDTRVYETSLESGRLYGFGGTRFDIIERAIQNTIHKEKSKYPKAVFVITDGFGNDVRPEKPENWYWFLTPHNDKMNIPNQSHIYELKNFE